MIAGCTHEGMVGMVGHEPGCTGCGMVARLYPAGPGVACTIWLRPSADPTREQLDEAGAKAMAAYAKIMGSA